MCAARADFRNPGKNILLKFWRNDRRSRWEWEWKNESRESPWKTVSAVHSAIGSRFIAIDQGCRKRYSARFGRGHVSGESVFIDELPLARNELLVDFVARRWRTAKSIGLDVLKRRSCPACRRGAHATGYPRPQEFGPTIKDEQLLAEDEAIFLGHPVCIIAAGDWRCTAGGEEARKNRSRNLTPIFRVDQAIAAKSFIGAEADHRRGDVDAAIRRSRASHRRRLDIGGQEHFYLESQVCIAMPGEYGQMTVHSSTQHPTEVQSW